MLDPRTDRFHFGLIGFHYPEPFNDYLVAESINSGVFAKGVCHGWLGKYKGEDVEIYEIADPEWVLLGEDVFLHTYNFQTVAYDQLLIPALALSAIECFAYQLISERRLRRIRAEELCYARNKKFLCTEMANESWWTFGYPLIRPGIAPTPSAFKQVELAGKIKRVYKGDLTDL